MYCAARSSVRGSDYNAEPARRPQVQLIHTQAKRDGTTGMVIEDAVAGQAPSIASALRGRSVATEDTAKPAVADFGNDSSYLDIPAFLRRQAD